ncbi:hypothetical protein R3P38DRAFT_3211675 [Favolaschia claudopus]|uniref:Uncharacterized protein n=1 Tax=Favolaschia claudopus TaxID=2862362 RepID=A0AAW0AFA8_9AGAR
MQHSLTPAYDASRPFCPLIHIVTTPLTTTPTALLTMRRRGRQSLERDSTQPHDDSLPSLGLYRRLPPTFPQHASTLPPPRRRFRPKAVKSAQEKERRMKNAYLFPAAHFLSPDYDAAPPHAIFPPLSPAHRRPPPTTDFLATPCCGIAASNAPTTLNPAVFDLKAYTLNPRHPSPNATLTRYPAATASDIDSRSKTSRVRHCPTPPHPPSTEHGRRAAEIIKSAFQI